MLFHFFVKDCEGAEHEADSQLFVLCIDSLGRHGRHHPSQHFLVYEVYSESGTAVCCWDCGFVSHLDISTFRVGEVLSFAVCSMFSNSI